MVKNPSFQSEIDRNAELGRIRVPIWEAKKIMEICSRNLQIKFDEHFEILALLTNEHIRTSSLTDDDEKYYKACEKSSLCREKRRISTQMYKDFNKKSVSKVFYC